MVGASQQLSITKQVAVVGGGAAIPGAELEYVVRVTNIASVPALYVVADAARDRVFARLGRRPPREPGADE